MNILSLNEVSILPGSKVFRARALPSILISVIFAGAAVALIVSYCNGNLPLWPIVVFVPFLALLTLLLLSMVRKAFLATNWLMALSPGQVMLKYRSYLNCRMSPLDQQIITIDLTEISGICKVKRKEITFSNRSSKQTQYLTFLDIMLNNDAPPELKAALTDERSTRNKQKTWSGSTSSKSHDYPVTLKDDSTLRVKMTMVRPSVSAAINWFTCNQIEQMPLRKETQDFTVTVKDKKQMDENILNLAINGKKIAAIKLTRKAYDMSLAQAKDFVDGLIE